MSYPLSPNVRQLLQDSDTRIVITGAGGWLGLATLELLDDALGESLSSRVHCFGSSRRELRLLSGTTLTQEPLDRLAELDNRPTIVLHLAFLTKDRAETMAEADYRRANRDVSHMVLASLDSIGTQAAFVASSGAAQLADDLDRSAAMRLYGELKRDDEKAFSTWAEEQGKQAVICRIFNISGPHINKHESYALACFILNALAGQPIAIKAPHKVIRSYVAVRELMSLVFALLLTGPKGVTQFASGGEPMEMQEIAKVAAELLGPVSINRPSPSDAATDDYTHDNSAYLRLLSDHEIEPVPFRLQVTETAAYLASETVEL